MQKKQIFWLIFWICVIATIITFALSSLVAVLKIVASAFLTISLGMLSFHMLKKHKKQKHIKEKGIDELLSNEEESQVLEKKQTFYEKNENFGNSLAPYALVFFTFCSLCLFIALLTI